ncbi:MAG: site-specific integrase [Caldilineaceae bacterium]
MKLTQSYNTWVNYVFDLKCFFTVTCKLPSAITRADCLAFMQAQDQAGYAEATINRRLAAVSSLFNEHPVGCGAIPITPSITRPLKYRVINQSKACIAVKHNGCLTFCPKTSCKPFLLPSPVGRPHTLVLLMWVSCLRIGEAVAVRFQDIECSRRNRLPVAKWGNVRTVFMDPTTFNSLNRYLDEERKDLFPVRSTVCCVQRQSPWPSVERQCGAKDAEISCCAATCHTSMPIYFDTQGLLNSSNKA